MLEKAIALAVKMHEGQKDKAGKPYILHPMRVMLSGSTEDEMIVGILHDVIEDTPCTKEDLIQAGFSLEIANWVDEISRKKEETYMEFIERCAQDKLLINVKLNDIKDNKDLSRIKNPTAKDFSRMKRYETAEKVLFAAKKPNGL